MVEAVDCNSEIFNTQFFQFFLAIPSKLRSQSILEKKQQNGLSPDLFEEIEELFDELASAENLLSQGRQYFFEAIEHLSAKLRTQTSRANEYEEQLEEKIQELQIIKGNMSEFQEVYKSIESRNRILNGKIDELEQDQRKLESLLNKEFEEKSCLNRRVKELETESAQQRLRHSEISTDALENSELGSSSNNSKGFVSGINNGKQLNMELREKMTKLEAESCALRSENEELNERYCKLMENYKITLSIKEKLEKLKFSHNQQIAQLREENDLLKIQLTNLQQEQERYTRLNTDITEDFRMIVNGAKRNTNIDQRARMSFAAFDFNHNFSGEGFNFSFSPRESAFPLQKEGSGVNSLQEKINIYGRESELRRQPIVSQSEKNKTKREKFSILSLLCCTRK